MRVGNLLPSGGQLLLRRACRVVIWALSGPVFYYSDTWQLIINTGTTVVTFLMLFLMQTLQNHDSLALHLKLDELLRATQAARNSLVDLQSRSEEELAQLGAEFRQVHDGACAEEASGASAPECDTPASPRAIAGA